MGSGSRARSRGINPKDNFLVETSHRAVVPAGSPRAEISSVRVDISDANESGAWCRACAASTTNPRPVHLPPTPNDSSAVGRAVSRATVSYDAAACRACGRRNASSGAGSPSTSPPSPLAKSAEYLLERYAERRALGGSAQTSRGGDVRSVGDLVGGNRGVAPVDEAPVGDGLELGHENATKPSHTKQTCDACAACADTCGVVGCGTCGGPVQLANETSASSPHFGDVELADNERGVSLEAAAAAAAGAAAAAANPRREGWGRDASSVFAVNDDDDDDTSASSTGTKHARQFTCCEVHRRRKNGQVRPWSFPKS